MYRLINILDILSTHNTVKVSFLSETLNVSRITLRKELNKLEKRGIIKCTRGHVSLDGADITSKRLAFNHLIKRKIAKVAVETIEEGETIMLESGSCCALFAEELILARKNVTIITNSMFIANYVSNLSDIKIILLGGCFQPDSQVLIGPMTTNCAESIYSDKFFIGADGFIPEQGFTCSDLLRVETTIGLAKRANKVFVLTESAKFNRRGTCSLIHMDKLAGVFTDDSIPKEAETALINNKVMLHKVFISEEKIKWRQFPGHTPILYTEKE